MNQYYQSQSPLARRATLPMTLAPTAPMIDPSLENHQFQHAQLPQGYANPRMQNHPAIHNAYSNPHPNPPPRPLVMERTLPAKEVNDQNIDEAYVQFILYCNPSIPLDVDTTELRRGFRAPPKSDGHTFSPYTIFGLLQRLENKDIKTWTQLVTELGVEPPDLEKNQSTQKVQQYAVRLKRWLHAFHIDAFFNYLFGKHGTYHTDRPATDESLAETSRDGVPPEEDLAVRALLPEWRPKRGRRKAEDNEGEAESNSANKKQHVRGSSADFTSMFEEPYSAAPSSAMQWSAQASQPDPWAAAHVAIAPRTPSAQTPSNQQLSAQVGGQQMRWRFNDETPSSPYPHSALTPRQGFSASPSFDEPRSAHPSSTTASKSPSRNRRKHGPAISSAWPSNSSSGSGKIRGRPPSNRSIQDGPFSTFPANPNTKEAPTLNITSPAQASTSSGGTHDAQQQQNLHQTTTSIANPQLTAAVSDQSAANMARKPSKLQLQVPEHSGAPVRLATPPRVLINGETNRNVSGNSHDHHVSASSANFFSQLDEGFGGDEMDEGDEEGEGVDWKRRALVLKRRLAEKEEELKSVKRRVLEAVM